MQHTEIRQAGLLNSTIYRGLEGAKFRADGLVGLLTTNDLCWIQGSDPLPSVGLRVLHLRRHMLSWGYGKLLVSSSRSCSSSLKSFNSNVR